MLVRDRKTRIKTILIGSTFIIILSGIMTSFTLPSATNTPVNYEWMVKNANGYYLMVITILAVAFTNFALLLHRDIDHNNVLMNLYLITLVMYQSMLAFITFAKSPYRDVFLHGGTVKYLLDKGMLPMGTAEATWPFSYYLQALFVAISGLDIVFSNSLLYISVSILLVITLILLMKVLLASFNTYEFEVLLASSILIYYAQFNHYNSFLHYCRAQLGLSMLMIIYYVFIKLLQEKKYIYSSNITLLLLLSSLLYTHSFYSTIYLGSIAFVAFTLYISRYISRKLPTAAQSRQSSFVQRLVIEIFTSSLILFLMINLVQSNLSINVVYAHVVKGITRDILELASGIIQVREKLPLLGEIVRIVWKAMLISMLILSMSYLYISLGILKQNLGIAEKLFLGHALSSIMLLLLFLYIPGFTGRVISFLAIPLTCYSIQATVLLMKRYKRYATELATLLHILSLISFMTSNILVFFDPPISGRFAVDDIMKPLYQVFNNTVDVKIVFLQNSPLYILAKYFATYERDVFTFEAFKSAGPSLLVCVPSIDIPTCENSSNSNSLIINAGAVYGIHLL